MKYLHVDLIISVTLPQVIAEVVDIGILRPATLPLVILEYIIVVMLLEMDLDHKRLDTLTLNTREQ